MTTAFRAIVYMLFALVVLVGCTAESCHRYVAQPSDSLYTEAKAMAVYARDLKRALQIIDSAEIVGNVSSDRADLFRAMAFSRTSDSPRFDTAVVISERLLNTDVAKTDTAFCQGVLEVLVYSMRQLEDYESQLVYSTRLADAYHQQGENVEAMRTEAEIGAVLCRLGKTVDGMGKIDSIINVLTPVRRFNELDASIIAMKRKISVARNYDEIAATAQCILDRLADFEQHPADYHDGSSREPADEDRPHYISFYRSQAWAFLAGALAHDEKNKAKAKEYLSLAGQSDFCQTLAGKKMIAPTLRLLGDYPKMEAIYQELETVFKERGDTLTLDYAQILLDRAKAAEAQGRMSQCAALWEEHARILQKAEERLLQSKANLYAARYHAQEQQVAIGRQQAEITRKNIMTTALAIGLVALLAVVVYVLRQRRILKRKNSVLAREISEAITYKEKYRKVVEERMIPADGQGAAIPRCLGDDGSVVVASAVDLTDEQLFRYIREVVMRDKLFLNPVLNRQMLTERFSLTKEQLGAAFTKGSPYKSVTDFINDCRLPYAAKLLTDRPDLSIAEVAEASGFARAATFTANFKKKYSITPAHYREQYES